MALETIRSQRTRATLARLDKRRDVSKDVEAVRAYLRKKIMTESDVVASTCSNAEQGFVDHLLQGDISFEVCIIDEASGALGQPSCPDAAAGYRAGGDTALPATVISPDRECGAGATLFEGWAAQRGWSYSRRSTACTGAGSSPPSGSMRDSSRTRTRSKQRWAERRAARKWRRR